MHIFFSAMEGLILEIKGEIFGFILVPYLVKLIFTLCSICCLEKNLRIKKIK